MPRPRVTSLEDAAAFVEDVGIALLFPRADLVLPSLWEAVAGTPEIKWAVRDDTGKFIEFTPAFDSLWRWKDELPARRLACAGKHAAPTGTLISPALLAPLYALTERPGRPDDFRALEELTPVQREVAEAVLECGPCTRPEIRELLGTDEKRRVDAAVEKLQRLLVLTHASAVEQEHGWPATALDVFARHWRERLRRLPAPDDARRTLAEHVLAATDEASAADLAAAAGWRRREASTVLEELAEAGVATTREEDGIRIWSSARELQA